MARKDDILSIYAKEVEDIKEAGLFKGEAPIRFSQGARRNAWRTAEKFICMCAQQLSWTGRQPETDRCAKRTYDEQGIRRGFRPFHLREPRTFIKNWRAKISNFPGNR
ncbi:MAG: hypothetical protein ACLTT1_15500 [[Clostridium] scindens]